MPLTLKHDWAWDFWFAHDGMVWHLYHLRAPRALGDPVLRHRNATIGHARSVDLSRWDVLPDALGPGPPGEWDDLATWTGSTLRAGGVWWMFYTGVSTLDDGKVQRIGAATSNDLSTWTKAPSNPLCVADSQWYEKFDSVRWYEEAWRDPWVFGDPNGDGYHMFVTAREHSGPPESAGVIGHAVSSDLVSWTVRPPLITPGSYGHLEVPQHVVLKGRHYLIFSVPSDMQPGLEPEEALTGIGYFVADVAEGPYRYGPTPFIAADRFGTLYAGKIVIQDDHPMLMATMHNTSDGRYVGGISDPTPILVSDDGELSIANAPTRPRTS